MTPKYYIVKRGNIIYGVFETKEEADRCVLLAIKEYIVSNSNDVTFGFFAGLKGSIEKLLHYLNENDVNISLDTFNYMLYPGDSSFEIKEFYEEDCPDSDVEEKFQKIAQKFQAERLLDA